MKKRKDGRYIRSITVGFLPDGKPDRKYIYGYTKAELENNIVEAKAKLNKGLPIDESEITVEEWGEHWFKTYKSKKGYYTKEMYNYALYTHIIPYFGHFKMNQVKNYHVSAFISEKYDNYSFRTLQIMVLTLKQIFKTALNNDIIFKNPVDGIILTRKDSPEKRALEDWEKDIIQEAAQKHRGGIFAMLILYTGMRPGEAVALTWNDIDMNKKEIHISKAAVFEKSLIEIKSPKTKAGFRTLPILDELFKFLTEKEKKGISVTGIISKSSYRRLWEGFMKAANILAGGNDKIKVLHDITPYTLRHTYITMLYYAGVDLKTAQYLAGHASIKMIFDVYTHLDKKNNINAFQKINDYICGQKAVKHENKANE